MRSLRRAGGLSALKLTFPSLVVDAGVTPHSRVVGAVFAHAKSCDFHSLNSKQNWEYRSWLSVE